MFYLYRSCYIHRRHQWRRFQTGHGTAYYFRFRYDKRRSSEHPYCLQTLSTKETDLFSIKGPMCSFRHCLKYVGELLSSDCCVGTWKLLAVYSESISTSPSFQFTLFTGVITFIGYPSPLLICY